MLVSVAPVSAPAAKLAAVAAPEAVSVPVNTSPTGKVPGVGRVQDLRDVARDRSFKHVFLVVVTRIRNDGVLYFRSAPYLYAK